MFHIFRCRKHFWLSKGLALAKFRVISHPDFTVRVRAVLCRDQDYTRGGTCTVNSAGRGIFQYVDGFDIILVQGADITSGKAINYDKR